MTLEILSTWIDSWSVQIGVAAWIPKLVLVAAVVVLVDFIHRRLMKILREKAEATSNPWDDAVISAGGLPVTALIWFLGASIALQLLPLQDTESWFGGANTPQLRRAGIILALAWYLLRMVRGVECNVLAASEDATQLDKATIGIVGKIIKIIILAGVGLVILDQLGIKITGLLAAGGIGGLALALAAKDLLANLFGGLNILLNQPFSVGDWIRSPEQEIEGVVEHIGWRQTTIRRFNRRPLYVPNSVFTNIAVENPSRMSHRRISETISIRHDDIGSMEAIVSDVKSMLESHPDIDQNQSVLVYFDRFGETSLDFNISCFSDITDGERFFQIRQDILFGIYRTVNRYGAKIALPASTIKIDSKPDAGDISPGSAAKSGTT